MDRLYIKYDRVYKNYLSKYLKIKSGTFKSRHDSKFSPSLQIRVFYDFKDEDYDQFIKDNIDIDKYLTEMYSKYGKSDPNFQIDFKKAFPFYYVYVLKIEFDGEYNSRDKITIDNSHIEKITKIENDIYIHFFHFGATNRVKLNFEKRINIKKVSVFECSYKNADSFMIGKTKPLKHIYHIVEQQRLSRNQYPKNISTIRLNEITAHKLDYHQYLIDHNLLLNTEIIKNIGNGSYKINRDIIDDISKENYVIKFPFHSASSCVFVPGQNPDNAMTRCYLDTGYIKQKFNPTLSKYEFKSHVINGEIFFIMVRDHLGEYVCVSKELKTKIKPINDLLIKYGSDMRETCKNVFRLVNKLIYLKQKRQDVEMNKLNEILSKVSDKTKKIIQEPLKETVDKIEYVTTFESIFQSQLVHLKMRKLD